MNLSSQSNAQEYISQLGACVYKNIIHTILTSTKLYYSIMYYFVNYFSFLNNIQRHLCIRISKLKLSLSRCMDLNAWKQPIFEILK